ncbi:MAG: glycerate kinase [Deltaproteobacteria bacterium]|nr:glycerate kinase [Deltaproteobacteria bacterium]
MNPQKFLNSLFEIAVAKAQPVECIPPYLSKLDFTERTVVFGAGKASAAMAQTVERNTSANLEGLVITRYGHAVECQQIKIVEAGHPIPDREGMRATESILKTASRLTEKDSVLCLISGGGSSLLSLPAKGLSLEDKKGVTSKLLKCGATIHEINCVRKHLSAIKGGRLAVACSPANLLTLTISDVPGDDLSIIASGPTVPDPSTFRDALKILAKYNISEPNSVLKYLKNADDETPKPGDSRLQNVENYLIATPKQSLHAASQAVIEAGIKPLILGDNLEGESRDVGKIHAEKAIQIQKYGNPISPPVVILSGGETSVTVKGSGRGGPNTEFILSLLQELRGQDGVWAIACDTDGIDGTEDNAGAFISPESFKKSQKLGLDPSDYISNNDSYSFFHKLGGLVSTGPTMTNVNDFRALLVLPQ